MIQTLCFFICILVLRDKSSTFTIIKLDNLKHLLASNRFLSYLIAINLFAMAGLPPLLGFFSKFYIFSILIENNSIYTIIFLLIMSCISTFYYIRVVQAIFFHTNSTPKFFDQLTYPAALIIVIITFINLLFFCIPWLFMDIIYEHVYFVFIQILNLPQTL